MADQRATIDAAGCLGRFLTVLGTIWIGIVVLGGMGLLAELGFSGGFLAGVGGTIVPGLMLLVAGRALRRRAAVKPEVSGRPQTGVTPPILPGGSRKQDLPRPAQKAPIQVVDTPEPPTRPVVTPPAAKPAESRVETQAKLDQVFSSMGDKAKGSPPTPARPKTSAEMIEEAHRKWGTGRKP